MRTIVNNIIRAALWVPFLIGMLFYIIKDNISILAIVCFIDSILYLIVEIYKLKFGKNTIDTSKGLAKLLFEKHSIIGQSGMFFKESILNASGIKIILPWFVLLFSIGYIIFFIVTRLIP
jgi:hypothetical protein